MAAADSYDIAAALAEFHESGGGVRHLVESGITFVPRLFLVPDSLLPPPAVADFAIPTVDLSLPRSNTIALIGAAARSSGFFHVTNHGVPASTIAAAISAARAFHELPLHERSAFYSVTPVSDVAYSTNPHPPNQLNAPALPWRDTLSLCFLPPEPDLGSLPPTCRDALLEYHRSLMEFGRSMTALLSEALGVGAERLEQAMQVEARLMGCHYYPPCPEPARVVGGRRHTDPSLFTVLVQDSVGGLQVRQHCDDAGGDGEWVDVAPVPGAILINIGDVLKVVSNEEFKSVEHRVMVKSTQVARVSIALFFNPAKCDESDLFGPLPELVTDERPARYQRITFPEFMNFRRVSGHGRT
ncbi:hypothetical protein EJB05_57263 [Eragrostis curvula]|uniref:Fe2OG dioxygenase domain-containing protein n=1 Tax=Eragrostis curvula TaxID=38414 RepID=A0A5J9SF22_9POAL|nr:hypothetical protein EJB05_57263 [Eragrostis curvula]